MEVPRELLHVFFKLIDGACVSEIEMVPYSHAFTSPCVLKHHNRLLIAVLFISMGKSLTLKTAEPVLGNMPRCFHVLFLSEFWEQIQECKKTKCESLPFVVIEKMVT